MTLDEKIAMLDKQLRAAESEITGFAPHKIRRRDRAVTNLRRQWLDLIAERNRRDRPEDTFRYPF